MQIAVIVIASAITSNIALSSFLGMCPFVALSKNVRAAAGMGIAVTLVMVVTAAANNAIYLFVLTPLNLGYLEFIVFIVSIAGIVQAIEILIERYFPSLYMVFGIYLPLITVNCSILGVSLFMVLREYDMASSLAFSLGSGLGWMLAITAMAGLRKYLSLSTPLSSLGETGITVILAGLMSLAFLGFQGVLP
jgi:Na+-transporting NADH:ubiquinone oxidoreductase subunit E